MLIQGIGLNTSDLDAQLKFYEDVLGFQVIARRKNYDESFTVQTGATKLTFIKSYREEMYRELFPELGKPSEIHHFAFNIPENQIEQAAQWLQGRGISLLIADGRTIFNFESWNAHSIYFKDPQGNILEFIARHTLSNVNNKPFSTDSILSISEIGITVEDVPASIKQISSTLGLPVYKDASDTFAAMGDENGLFILVKRDRIWYPQTGIPAGINFHNISIYQKLNNQAEIKKSLLTSSNICKEFKFTFVESWNAAEHFYRKFEEGGWVYLKQYLIPFIKRLRRAGYDKHIRAGTSMTNFILSRSIKHGLRNGQAAIVFEQRNNGTLAVSFYQSTGVPISGTPFSLGISRNLILEKPELTDELEGLLLRLLMQPID